LPTFERMGAQHGPARLGMIFALVFVLAAAGIVG
jgi:hypothetical protein